LFEKSPAGLRNGRFPLQHRTVRDEAGTVIAYQVEVRR